MHWLLLLFASSALASSGDRAFDFRACLDVCKTNECKSPDAVELPLSLRLTRWTCEDTCKYECMQTITDKAIANGVDVQQYYGKWPFWRFAGMQEPASVLFSLLTLYGHVQG